MQGNVETTSFDSCYVTTHSEFVRRTMSHVACQDEPRSTYARQEARHKKKKHNAHNKAGSIGCGSSETDRTQRLLASM